MKHKKDTEYNPSYVPNIFFGALSVVHLIHLSDEKLRVGQFIF